MEILFNGTTTGALNLAAGPYTPVPTFTGVLSGALVNAEYIRVLNTVTVRARLTVAASGAGAGTVVIPVPVATTGTGASGAFVPGAAALGPSIPMSFAANAFTASATATGAQGAIACDFSFMYVVA